MSAGDYFPAHYSVLFPPIQQSIIRVSPAAFALWGKILTSTTSSNAFCIVCSSEPDGGLFIPSVPCHYFTAVGESSPSPDHTHVGFKTRPLLTEYFCLHRQEQYAQWFSLKRQCRHTLAIHGHVGCVRLVRSAFLDDDGDSVSMLHTHPPVWTGFYSRDKWSLIDSRVLLQSLFHLVSSWACNKALHLHCISSLN